MDGEYWCHACNRTVQCSPETLCLNCGFGGVEKVQRRPLPDVAMRLEELGGLPDRVRLLFEMLNEAYEAEDEVGMAEEEIDMLSERDDLDEHCSICIQDREDRVVALPCGHSYHDLCLRNWLKVKAICPICKRSARHEDSDREEFA